LPVDSFGMVRISDVKKAITPQTILITIMHANNEVGTIQPIEQISGLAKRHRILMHTDAAQSVGKIPISMREILRSVFTISIMRWLASRISLI